MKFFIVFVTVLVAANAEVSSHATISHGHAPIHAIAPVHHAPVHHPAPVHQPSPVYHSAPVYKPAPVYHPVPVHKPVYHPAPVHKQVYKEPVYDTIPQYKYEYAVQDDYSGVNFGQNEARDGYSTYGEYRVALPDCRTQIVKYNTVDAYSGNIMEVVYEGTPCYNTYQPVHKAVPVHKPAPVYHP